ncbi:MAG: Lipoprotein signal peptidase, partial [uncultured Solirubrobacteraceae bacterium]
GPRRRPADQGAGPVEHRPRRRRRAGGRRGPGQRAQLGHRLRAVLRRRAVAGAGGRDRDARPRGDLRDPRRHSAGVAAGRPAAGRRAGQPRRPRARGRGDRLHRSALLAGVQPRRLGDHRGGARAALRHGGPAAAPARGGAWL